MLKMQIPFLENFPDFLLRKKFPFLKLIHFRAPLINNDLKLLKTLVRILKFLNRYIQITISMRSDYAR